MRYGIAEQSYGFTEIRDYRQQATAVHSGRKLDHTAITSFGRDIAISAPNFSRPTVRYAAGKAIPGCVRQWLENCCHTRQRYLILLPMFISVAESHARKYAPDVCAIVFDAERHTLLCMGIGSVPMALRTFLAAPLS